MVVAGHHGTWRPFIRPKRNTSAALSFRPLSFSIVLHKITLETSVKVRTASRATYEPARMEASHAHSYPSCTVFLDFLDDVLYVMLINIFWRGADAGQLAAFQ